MKTFILYCSHTGNTKRFAEAIRYLLKAPIFNATNSEPSVADDFELVIIGAPAIGLRLTPEVSSLVKRLSKRKGRRVFCLALTL